MGLTRTKNGVRLVYDERECWEQYMVVMCGAASHIKLIRWLWETKKIKTSSMGAFWAMWRHAMRNPEEAYPQYKKWFFETASKEQNPPDPNASFRDFLEEVAWHLRHRCSAGRYEYSEFINKYDLKPYLEARLKVA